MSEKTAIRTPEALFDAIGTLLEKVIEYGPLPMPDDMLIVLRKEGLAAIREFQRHIEQAARSAAKEQK